jgi:plastocyanin
MGDHYIDPVVLTVKVGATVTWRNSSGQHDVRARDGSFSSPTLGDFYSHTFTKPGRYLYYCSFHQAEMRGEIIVVPAN